MKGGEKRLVFLCILLFAASLDVFAERSHDAAVSDLYVRNSYNLFSEGKMGEAGKLLDLALEFEEENPDALYLAGLIAGRGQKGLREAVRLFEKACSSSEWDIFSRSDAWFALGRALLSLREASASLRAFSEAREAQSANPEFYLFFSRALAESGETREAVRFLRAAVKGFPNNSALKRLLAAYDPQYITELSRQYFEVGDPSVFDAGLLEEAVRFAPNPGLKGRLIDEYTKRFGESLAVSVEDLRNGSPPSEEALRRLVGLGLFKSQEFTVKLYASIEDESAKAVLISLFSGFSGVANLDENDDGIPEAFSVFKDGSLVSRTVDRDQDGVPEFSLQFSSGRLERAEIPNGIAILYSFYPFVRDISFSAGTLRSLTLAEREFSYPLVQLSPVPFIPPEITPPGAVAESRLAHLVQKGKEVSLSGFGSLDWEVLQDGILLEHTQLPVGAKIIRTLKDGTITRASISVDGDDEPEVFEDYRNGNLIARRWDADHDGVDEFITQYGSPVMNLWDVNMDGRTDIRSYKSGEYERYDYASALDGNFNLSLFIKERSIVFVEKSGRSIPVVVNDGIGWIGGGPVPGFVFPGREPSFVSAGDRLYYCFTMLGSSYVEVLK